MIDGLSGGDPSMLNRLDSLACADCLDGCAAEFSKGLRAGLSDSLVALRLPCSTTRLLCWASVSRGSSLTSRAPLSPTFKAADDRTDKRPV